jgi:hypothetical protein
VPQGLVDEVPAVLGFFEVIEGVVFGDRLGGEGAIGDGAGSASD